MAQFKIPKFETKTHLPEIPGSFTFRKNGKLRLDQQVKKFCLLNKCRGCFEVKVHFGRHVNANHIKYDAKQNGMEFETFNDQKKYKLFVPYPKDIKLLIPSDPEAQFFCGILSAKLAIINYNKSILSKKKNNKKSNKIDDDDKNKQSKIKGKLDNKKNKKKKRKQRRQKRKISLEDLNKRIAQNSDNNEPPKKKKKCDINSNEMSVNDQHKLIDGLVDKIEDNVREQRRKELAKDDDIKQYLKQRYDKKKLKEQKKKDIREKFQARRMAKKKTKQSQWNTFKKSTGKKVTFNL